MSFKGKTFFAKCTTEKLAKEQEEHVFKKVKLDLGDALKNCLEERIQAGEHWVVKRIRFPLWVPLCFYYEKM